MDSWHIMGKWWKAKGSGNWRNKVAQDLYMTLYGLKKSVEHLDLSNGSRMEVGYSLLKKNQVLDSWQADSYNFQEPSRSQRFGPIDSAELCWRWRWLSLSCFFAFLGNCRHLLTLNWPNYWLISPNQRVWSWQVDRFDGNEVDALEFNPQCQLFPLRPGQNFLECDPHHLVDSAHYLNNTERKNLRLATGSTHIFGGAPNSQRSWFVDCSVRWSKPCVTDSWVDGL